MGDNTNWISTLQSGLTHLLDVFLNYLPQIIGATVLMLLGWVAAALLRMITMRAARGVGWFLPRVLPGAAAARLRTTLQPRLLGALVFWLVILAAAGAAAQVLGLEIFASWLDAVFSRLPQLVLALLIVAAGVGLSHVTRAGVVRAAAAGGLENRALLGYSVQAIILAAAAAIALDVVGLDITFLVVLVAILLAAVSGGAALAFGLGSRVFGEQSAGRGRRATPLQGERRHPYRGAGRPRGGAGPPRRGAGNRRRACRRAGQVLRRTTLHPPDPGGRSPWLSHPT